ncbi:MAG: hypothetical protein J6A19_12705 [Oscillospiraceae bacterium]|nr:hypothetical protein [Oscillospiraceae bacterium]
MDILISGNDSIIKIIALPLEQFSGLPEDVLKQIADIMTREDTAGEV